MRKTAWLGFCVLLLPAPALWAEAACPDGTVPLLSDEANPLRLGCVKPDCPEGMELIYTNNPYRPLQCLGPGCLASAKAWGVSGCDAKPRCPRGSHQSEQNQGLSSVECIADDAALTAAAAPKALAYQREDAGASSDTLKVRLLDAQTLEFAVEAGRCRISGQAQRRSAKTYLYWAEGDEGCVLELAQSDAGWVLRERKGRCGPRSCAVVRLDGARFASRPGYSE